MGEAWAARERFHLPVAIWRCQYQLLGGNRRIAAILVITALAIVVGVLGMRRIFWAVPFPALARQTITILGAIQVAIAVLGGCNAVYRAMLLDHQSKMIESHRLTPMSSIAVVLGYLFGSTVQITSLFAVILTLGAAISYLGTVAVTPWFSGNLFLLHGALTLWSAVIFVNMRVEKPFSPMPVLVGISALTSLAALIPGIALVFNIYVVLFAWWVLTGAMTVPPAAVGVVAAVNGGFTLFWLSAAAKKYRRPDLPALVGLRGLLLLGLAMVIGTLGIEVFDRITLANMPTFYDRDLPLVQWVSTIIAGMLLAAVPIAGSVKCRILAARGSALRDWTDRLSPTLVAFAATLLICLIAGLLGSVIWQDFVPEPQWQLGFGDPATAAWLATGASCLGGALGVRGAMAVGHGLIRSPRFTAISYFAVCWAVPVIADLIRAESSRGPRDGLQFSWLMTSSPAGGIVAAWSGCGLSMAGLLVQFAVTGLLCLLGERAEQAVRRSRKE